MKFHAVELAPRKNAKPKAWEGKHPLYFEAIMQLRNVQIEHVQRAVNIHDKAKVPIPKTVEQKTGIDLYSADAKTTKAAAKNLQKKYGGIYLVTAKLFSEKDGRTIYRLTVLYRAPHFKRGDLVMYKGETYEVKLLQDKVVLQNPKTGKKIQLKCNEKDMALIKNYREEQEQN